MDNQKLIEQNEQIILKLNEQNQLIVDELKRQSEERELKAKETEQAREQAKVKEAEQKAVAADEKKQSADRYEFLVKSMADIAKNVADETKLLSETTNNDELLKELKLMNKNTTTLVEYQKHSQSYQLNQQSLGTMTVVLLMGGIGAFLLYKFGSFVVSKIIKMIA